MKFSIENVFFILSSSLATEKQGLGLKFSSETECVKPGMIISSANEDFVRGVIFSCVRARMIFFDLRAWVLLSRYPLNLVPFQKPKKTLNGES